MKTDEWVNKEALVIFYRKLNNKELQMNRYCNNRK